MSQYIRNYLMSEVTRSHQIICGMLGAIWGCDKSGNHHDQMNALPAHVVGGAALGITVGTIYPIFYSKCLFDAFTKYFPKYFFPYCDSMTSTKK